jgi:hypothetical protein
MAQAKSTSPTTDGQAEGESTRSWFTFKRAFSIALALFIGIFIMVFACGFIASLLWNESAASFFSYFRDLMTIGLTMSGIMIVVGIGILIAQIARFVNLIRSEIKPITEDTKQAIRNVRATTEFVQKHAVEPIIQFQSFLAGLIAFLREIVIITQILQRHDADKKQDTDNSSETE